MRTPVLSWVVSAATALALFPTPALGATEGAAPAGGGLGTLAVRVDLAAARVFYRSCPSAPCVADAASDTLTISLAPNDLPEPAKVVVEPVAVGAGKTLLHVLVPSHGDPDAVAWEAILAAGKPPIFADKTGFVKGEEGERYGPLVEIRDTDHGKSVLVGTVRQDLHICGQTKTLLEPRGLDPGSLELRGATIQRLPPDQRANAQQVVAASHGGPADPPLARLVTAAGASGNLAQSKLVADGDPATTWSEARPGAGQGEFLMLRTQQKVPIARVAVAIAPPMPPPLAANGAAPQTFFLVTTDQTFAVTMPEDAWQHPGAAYDVPLPAPVRSSCLAVVLDQAYNPHHLPHPEVTIAEVYAYSEFDAPGATLETVAKALAGGGARAEAAAGVLDAAGERGFAAMVAVYASLDAPGRAAAVDVAVSQPCELSAPLLLRAAQDPDANVRRKGRDKLDNPNCARAAIPAFAQALADASLRAQAALRLARAAHDKALAPLAGVMGDGNARLRAAVRDAFARAAKDAPRETLAALLADAKRAPDARLELVRASLDRLPEVRVEADAVITDLSQGAQGGAPMRTRYLLEEPLAVLARSGDAQAGARFVELLARDPEGPVRAHAAELAVGVAPAEAALLAAVRDPEPRVREAALHALAAGRLLAAAEPASDALAHDDWTFVRTAAATALSTLPPSPAVDRALTGVLEDPSPRIRAASLDALAARRATGASETVRDILDDDRQTLDVRLAATHALGLLCDVKSLDHLTKLARAGADPLADEAATQLSRTATDALGAIHPADLAARLAPLRVKGVREEAQQSAARAMAARPMCR